jgi:membrane protein YdbS with pleckstrin-like domain
MEDVMKSTGTAYQNGVSAVLVLALAVVAALFLRTEGSPADAMALAVVALVVVGAIVYTATNRHTRLYRWAVALALAGTFILFWAIGGVALLGPELGRNTADLIYFAVPVVGVIGAIAARFQPHGMALAMLGAAVAVMVLPVLVVAGLTPLSPNTAGELFPYGLLVFHSPFAALFLGSAWLFHRCAQRPPPATAQPA